MCACTSSAAAANAFAPRVADGGSSACWTIHCDGSALPNPGRMGLGAVLAAPDGTRHTLSVSPQATGCNNEAELRAFVLALRAARDHGARAIAVFSDNAVLVERIGGTEAVAPPWLAPLWAEARALWSGFADARLRWVPRHRNGEADALARAALGLVPKTAVPAGRTVKKRKRS